MLTIAGGMRAVLFLLVLSLSAFAAKNREWKDAKLTNMASSDNGAIIVPIGTGLYGGHVYRSNYSFDTADLVIVASDPRPRTLNLTINKPLKIAIEKQKLYVLDDDGKEIKLNIIGKRAK